MRPKPYHANIFEPSTGKHGGVFLKHWHNKRVKFRGRYVRIAASRHDRDMNFLHWIIYPNKMTAREHILVDPNYTAKVQKRIKRQLTSRRTLI